MIRFLLLPFLLATLQAELAPKHYLKMQKEAPEHLEIKVLKAKRGVWISPGEVVHAKVTKVHRSASKLKVGETIIIRYRRPRNREVVGPSPVPLLNKAKTYPAWIKKTAKGHFEPAAGGYTFRVTKKGKKVFW